MSDDVTHSGIKGMKWGVRRSRKELAKLRQGPSDDAKKAHKALVKSKISGVQALSNKELNALNQRLQLETNYSKLSYQPSKLKKGMDAVTQILSTGKKYDEIADLTGGKKIAVLLAEKSAKTATKKK